VEIENRAGKSITRVFAEQGESAASPAPAMAAGPAGAAAKLPVPPQGLSTHCEGEALVIAWRWYQVGYVVGVFFAAAIMGFFGWVMGQDHHDPTSSGTITSFLGMFIWPATLALLYWMLAGICNTTFITAHPARIEIVHRPIWWLGHKTRPVDNLAELETVQQVHKAGFWQGSVDYAITVRTADQRRWWLGGTLRTPDLADFIPDPMGQQ